MKTFVIADTHFGHKNIIKYGNRPFADVDEMREEIIERWNSVVKKDDIVYHLGDFSMTHTKDDIINLVNRLNGRIVLIMGNHDTKPHQWYMDCGFINTVRHPIIIDDNTVLMHEPPKNEFISPKYNYIFGHMHNSVCDADSYDNCVCVSVERINYTPVELKKIQASIDFRKNKQ